MMRARRASALAACLVLLWTSCGWGLNVGDAIPDFSFRAFDGTVASTESLRGKPILLVFWNTWCPTCMKDLPQVNRIHEAFGPKGLAVLAVNTALNDSENRARAYWEKAGYAFQGGFDRYFEIGQAFGVFAVPTFFLIDSNGVVLYKQSTLPGDMEERLKRLTRSE